MPRFSKLIGGELRKITLRPILYIITAVLVLALILSVTLFSPNQRIDDSYVSRLEGSTIGDVYHRFDTTSGMLNKDNFDRTMVALDETLTYYEGIVANPDTSFTSELKDLMKVVSSSSDSFSSGGKFEKYNELVTNSTDWSYDVPAVKAARIDLLNSVLDLKSRYEQIVSSTYTSVLVKSTDHILISELFNFYINTVNKVGVDYDNRTVHELIVGEVSLGTYNKRLSDKFDAITDVIIPADTLANLRTNYYSVANVRLLNKLVEIEEIYATNPVGTQDQVRNFKLEISYYYSTVDLLGAVINGAIDLEIIEGRSDAQMHEYNRFKDVYTYQIREDHLRNVFLFNNDKFSSDFANVFTVGSTSNIEQNAFDFMFFGLELFGFIIVITCIVLGAGMVAGEQSSGTLKLLAIRPYKRTKLLSGKLLSTIIFGFTLVIFSAIVLLLIGLTLYGINPTPILAVFNAQTVFTISPWLLMGIYTLMLLFKVFIYTLIAICISTLLKSNVAAVAISIMIYFLSSIFSVIFSASYWYAYVPFTNIDLFKFFGGAFVNSMGSNPLSFVFSSPMLYNMNFWLSIGLDVALIAVLFIITFTVFKRREIR